MGLGARVVRGFTYLVGLQFVGEFISRQYHLPLPGNVIGLLLIVLALIIGLIKLEAVEEAADLLTTNLMLMLIPLSVGIIAVLDLVKKEAPAIIASTVLSTFIVMVVTGKVVDWVAGRAEEDARGN
ncbi:MAG: CidA/LrgA family protein [Bacillota bacterium]